MGLSAAMVSALSGLRATQAAVDLVAQNVANAETAGYTKKSIQRETIVVNGLSIGVRATEVTRAIDALLLAQTRDEQGERARLDVIANALGQLDAVFGVPGGADSLDGAISAFVSALQDLSDAPEQQSLRSIVLSEAQALVAKINDLSQAVQGLRQQAESGLGDAVSRADTLMKEIAEINGRIVGDLADELSHFATAVLNGEPFVQHHREALAAIPVLDALAASARSGLPVDVDRS